MTYTGYMTFDSETSTQYVLDPTPSNPIRRVKDTHGPAAKDPRNDIYTFIYGDHPDRISVEHRDEGFKREIPPAMANMMEHSKLIIGQNLKFDLGYIWHQPSFRKYLLRGGKTWDIGLVHYLISGNRALYPSLADMQSYYLGIKTKDSRISRLFEACYGADEIIKRRGKCRRVFNLFDAYSKQDGSTPLKIFSAQFKIVKQLGLMPIVELFNDYLLSICMMEVNGIPVDVGRAEDKRREFNLQMVEYMEKAIATVSYMWQDPRLPPLNPNSNNHKSALLFGGAIKCEYYIETDILVKSGVNKGKPRRKKVTEFVDVKGFCLPKKYTTESKNDGVYATGKKIMEHILAEEKENVTLQTYAKYLQISSALKKMISTYLSAYIDKSIHGRIHPNFNQVATRTSRLSANDPNVQNIPKRSVFKDDIQGLMVAPDGWTCVQIDFSQLEIYIKAMESQDRQLISDLQAGVCFHCKRLGYMWNISYQEAYDGAKVKKLADFVAGRTDAKSFSFSYEYGAADETIAKQTGLPLETVQTISTKDRAEYWEAVAWEKTVQEQIESNSRVALKKDLSSKQTKPTKDKDGMYRKFRADGVELLPIRQADKITYKFDDNEIRHVGFYRSMTGKIYAFEELGSAPRGKLFRYYPPTKIKNYMIQGGAGDAQAATSVELLQFLLRNIETIKMINEIHDCKWFLIRDDKLDEYVPYLCNVISSVRSIFKRRFGFDCGFEFECDVEVGKNFAKMESYQSKCTVAA